MYRLGACYLHVGSVCISENVNNADSSHVSESAGLEQGPSCYATEADLDFRYSTASNGIAASSPSHNFGNNGDGKRSVNESPGSQSFFTVHSQLHRLMLGPVHEA